MRLSRVLFYTILVVSALFLPQTFAEDYTQWGLPEGAKLRIGKGEIPTNRLNQFPPYIFHQIAHNL